METVKKAISLNNPDYFRITKSELIALNSETIVPTRFTGIALAAPDRINLHDDPGFPMLVAIGFDAHRNISIENNLLTLAITKDGQIYIAPTVHQKKPVKPRGAGNFTPPPHDPDIDIYSSTLKKYDLRPSLEIPWKPATYRITCLYYDWISNTIETRLTDSKIETGAHEPLSPPPRIDAVVNVTPHTGKTATVLSFSLPESIPVDADRIMLKGAVGIETNPRCRAKTAENSLTAWKPLSLLLIEKDQGQRPVLQIDLTIAGTMTDNQSEEPLRLDGEFTIDLAQINGDYFSDEAEFCCYLIAYEKIAGPVFMKVAKKR